MVVPLPLLARSRPYCTSLFPFTPQDNERSTLITLVRFVQTCSINAYVFQFRSEPSLLGADVFSAPSLDGPTTDVKKLPSLWEILKKPVVHLFAGFVLIYVGTEVTIGGWIVTYIVEVRGGSVPFSFSTVSTRLLTEGL